MRGTSLFPDTIAVRSEYKGAAGKKRGGGGSAYGGKQGGDVKGASRGTCRGEDGAKRSPNREGDQ